MTLLPADAVLKKIRQAHYRQTEAGQDSEKRSHAKAALAKQAKRNQKHTNPGAQFEYKVRGGVATVRLCRMPGCDKPARKDSNYCSHEHYITDFSNCYCKETK